MADPCAMDAAPNAPSGSCSCYVCSKSTIKPNSKKLGQDVSNARFLGRRALFVDPKDQELCPMPSGDMLRQYGDSFIQHKSADIPDRKSFSWTLPPAALSHFHSVDGWRTAWDHVVHLVGLMINNGVTRQQLANAGIDQPFVDPCGKQQFVLCTYGFYTVYNLQFFVYHSNPILN